MSVGAPPEPMAAAARNKASIGLIIACAVLGSLAAELRIRGAQGDLWLDEIWSVTLVDRLRAGRFLIQSLALDNNHYLNTLYLALVGPDARALAYRSFSILLGIAAVPLAGYALRRSGTAGILAGMAFFSTGYVFVNYGSEARGYAGLILMTLAAIVLVERWFEAPEARTANRLGLVAAIGFLFQPLMVLSLAILGGWTAWRFWHETRAWRETVRRTWQLFMPAAAGLIPLLAVIGAAILRSGEYVVAAKTPFSVVNFLEGYAGLYRALLGLPDAIPDLAILLVPVAVLIAAQRLQRSPRASLGVIALILVPVVVFVARPPNVQYPRYYLASGIVFVLLLAELAAAAWRRGVLGRGIVVVLAAGIAAGNAAEIGKLFRFGRGDPLPSMQRIAEIGAPVLVITRDKAVVDYLAPRHSLAIDTVLLEDLCARRPPLMLMSDRGAPETATIRQAGCAVTYRREMSTPFWGLSGAPWTLYRKAE